MNQFRAYIHRHVFRTSHYSSVQFRLRSTEQIKSPECSKHQVLGFVKMLVAWSTNQNILVSSLFSRLLHELIHSVYPQTRLSSFPGIISVVWVNEQRTTDITRSIKAPGAEFCRNACVVVNEQKTFCSHQCSSECSLKKIHSVYAQRRVSSFPGMISVARVNKQRNSHVIRVLKAAGAELC